MKYPAPIAFVHFDRSGDPAAVCKRVMGLDVQKLVEVLCGAEGSVVIFVMEATGQNAAGTAAAGVDGAVAGMTMHHKPQEGYLIPVSTMWPWFMKRMIVIMKVIVQPLSVRVSMDIWDPDGRYGKMCDRRAAAGSGR